MPVESVHLPCFIPPAALLDHWQVHRRLTRRVIESFPEDRLFSFSIGSMRPFGALALEILSMAEPMVRGIVTGNWDQSLNRDVRPKHDILRLWDETTDKINRLAANTSRAFSRDDDGLWAISGTGLRSVVVCHRQRDPPSRSRICLPARIGYRAPSVLRAIMNLQSVHNSQPLNEPALLTGSQIRSLSSVISRICHDEPNLEYIVPDQAARRMVLPSFLQAAILAGQLYGQVRIGENHDGIAVWIGPEHNLRFRQIMQTRLPEECLERYMKLAESVEVARTNLAVRPHWYLMLLAADASLPDKIIGETLIAPV